MVRIKYYFVFKLNITFFSTTCHVCKPETYMNYENNFKFKNILFSLVSFGLFRLSSGSEGIVDRENFLALDILKLLLS